MTAQELATRGWRRFPHDPAVETWARHAAPVALAAEAAGKGGWMDRCDGTWFVGVDALPNDGEGRLPGGPALTGEAIDAARALVGAPFALHKAQASICRPGYPRRGDEESEAAFRYRLARDAAHVDGLHRIMPGRRRMLKEAHAFILGLPLTDASADAAPMVVWEGSHRIIAEAMRVAFSGASSDDWPDIDITEPYQQARKTCFETCKRIEIAARPGEAYLVHRLALHGVAHWRGGAGARAIAYFRPNPFPDANFDWWLNGFSHRGETAPGPKRDTL